MLVAAAVVDLLEIIHHLPTTALAAPEEVVFMVVAVMVAPSARQAV